MTDTKYNWIGGEWSTLSSIRSSKRDVELDRVRVEDPVNGRSISRWMARGRADDSEDFLSIGFLNRTLIGMGIHYSDNSRWPSKNEFDSLD